MDNINENLKYTIPFIKDTFNICTETLDYHADHRFPKSERPFIEIWKVSFLDQTLTMGIKIDDEPERRVFLKITEKELLVGCSSNTTKNHISRYAYYVLRRMASIDSHISFAKYYWPDFIDHNGESKYLDILNFRGDLEIYFKKEYIYFFKPGQHLEYPVYERKFNRPCAYIVNKEIIKSQISTGVGFCLFYCHDTYSTHLPVLIPYLGTVAKTKNSIKSFNQFITDDIDTSEYNFSEVQKSIFETCLDMMHIAAIRQVPYQCDKEPRIVIENANRRRYSKVLGLWHLVLASLTLQPYIHKAIGAWNAKRKVHKGYLTQIRFALETPEICFLWKDKGDYFELSYRLKINDEVLEPAEFLPPYFVSTTKEPSKFYLFQSATDCKINSFFKDRELKIYVLKVHFEKSFKPFFDELGQFYEIIIV
jgi:hypothetical protein